MIKKSILLIIGVYLSSVFANELQLDITTSSTPISTLQRSTAQDSFTNSEGLSKRDLKETDSSSANTIGISAKNYDPPPEFYRGPGSTGHHTSTQVSSYYNNFKPYNGFKSRPVAFPDAYGTNNNHNNYNKYHGVGGGGGGQQDNSDVHSANSYNSWQHLKGKVGALLNKKDALQDRISVGHYSTSEHASSASGGGGGGYAYEGRPYSGQVAAHHAEYLPSNSHFSSSVAPSAHPTGYYGGSVAAEGIPFDVYGNKNPYSGLDGNDYASYSYSNVQEQAAHKTYPDISHKALLAKSFLIPLASAAVLGIAAALVSNPLLLQLGTVSGVAPAAAVYGKRKRRDLTTSATPYGNDANAVSSVDKNKKNSNLFPYRGHHQQQKQHRHRHFVRV